MASRKTVPVWVVWFHSDGKWRIAEMFIKRRQADDEVAWMDDVPTRIVRVEVPVPPKPKGGKR